MGYWLGMEIQIILELRQFRNRRILYTYIQKEKLDKKIYIKANNKAKTINYSSFQKKNT